MPRFALLLLLHSLAAKALRPAFVEDGEEPTVVLRPWHDDEDPCRLHSAFVDVSAENYASCFLTPRFQVPEESSLQPNWPWDMVVPPWPSMQQRSSSVDLASLQDINRKLYKAEAAKCEAHKDNTLEKGRNVYKACQRSMCDLNHEVCMKDASDRVRKKADSTEAKKKGVPTVVEIFELEQGDMKTKYPAFYAKLGLDRMFQEEEAPCHAEKATCWAAISQTVPAAAKPPKPEEIQKGACTLADREAIYDAGAGHHAGSLPKLTYDCSFGAYSVFSGFQLDPFLECMVDTVHISTGCAKCFAGSAAYGAHKCASFRTGCITNWCSSTCLDCGFKYTGLEECVGFATPDPSKTRCN